MLRSRLRTLKHGGVPSAIPRSSSSAGSVWQAATSVIPVGERMRIIVQNVPSGERSSRASHSSSSSLPLAVPVELPEPPRAVPVVSLGEPPEDQMSITASEGEQAGLPPSGVVALAEPDPEMAAMLERVAANVGLVWNPPPGPEPSLLDDWSRGAGCVVASQSAPVPLSPECMRS
ncbi:hypothetical protein PO909_015172 [Leuciscus waleckii]